MFDKLTYKNKNRVMLVLAVALLYLVYKLAVSKTVKVYNDFAYLKSQVILSKNIDTKLDDLSKQLNAVEGIFKSSITSGNNSQEKILETVTNYCKQKPVLLKEFPKSMMKETNGYLVELNYFTVEGDYINLLNLVYTMEQQIKVGKVASVKFNLKENQQTKQHELTATIYVQNLKRIDS